MQINEKLLHSLSLDIEAEKILRDANSLIEQIRNKEILGKVKIGKNKDMCVVANGTTLYNYKEIVKVLKSHGLNVVSSNSRSLVVGEQKTRIAIEYKYVIEYKVYEDMIHNGDYEYSSHKMIVGFQPYANYTRKVEVFDIKSYFKELKLLGVV